MNLAFNAVMWGLFTRALTLASSTVRVSVINTSANFVVTAVLGAIIFRESLPGESHPSYPDASFVLIVILRALVAGSEFPRRRIGHHWKEGRRKGCGCCGHGGR